jgi:hypothetical protein
MMPTPIRDFVRRLPQLCCARLRAGLLDTFPLLCPPCGAEMRILACITEAAPVRRILTDIGEPPHSTALAPVREPLDRDEGIEPLPDCHAVMYPEPELDPRLSG